MDILLLILIFTFLGSIASLVGGIILLYKENFALKISHFVAAFAAGALLGTAFFDLLPEATEEGSSETIFFWTLAGILLFFLLERIVHWFHHHLREHPDESTKPTIPLVILGDTIHNFIDGIAIASTFLVNVPLGILTSFSVAAHEIPQEIGDFGVMLHKGLERKKILIFNLLSGLASVFGALLAFWLGDSVESLLPVFLAITAGFFIYIAASDLIPEIHHNNRKGLATIESLLLLAGVGTIWLFVRLFEG